MSRAKPAFFDKITLHVDHDQRRAGRIEIERLCRCYPRHQACPPV
ncbi:MAG: hypothetical protein ACJAQW_001536 [Paracoccaceae bacterium]|jgi:hypothetical protein